MSNTKNPKKLTPLERYVSTLNDLSRICSDPKDIIDIYDLLNEMEFKDSPFNYLRSYGLSKDLMVIVWNLTRFYKQANSIVHGKPYFKSIAQTVINLRGTTELKMGNHKKEVPTALIKSLRDRVYRKDLIRIYRELDERSRNEDSEGYYIDLGEMYGENPEFWMLMFNFCRITDIDYDSISWFDLGETVDAIRYLL